MALQQLIDVSNQDMIALQRELADAQSVIQHKVSLVKSVRVIEQLKTQSRHQGVAGYLWELALVEPTFSNALNSVLQSVLDFVVVRNRTAALQVTKIFATKSIGRVSCCIQEELAASSRCSSSTCGYSDRAQASSSTQRRDVSKPVPLCSTFQCLDDAFRPVFHRYCNAWLVCSDDDTAERVSKAGRKNCVTLKGDLFFADGSIRAFRQCSQIPDAKQRWRVQSARDSSGATAATGDDGSTMVTTARCAELSNALKQCEAAQRERQSELQEVRTHG